jgi:hypothetical protein
MIKRVIRITESIKLSGNIGFIRILRFDSSDIRAGLREADRVLAEVLWCTLT